MLAHGAQCFRFFTIDSNILAMVSAGIYLYFNILRFMGKEVVIPFWLKLFKFIATVAVMVTFFVVLVFLIPMTSIAGTMSPAFFYEQNCMILHLFGPLVAALTLVVFEKDDLIENKKYTFFSLGTVVVYGIVYFSCVVIAKVWPDFYGLTFDGRYYLSPIATLLILAVCYGSIELLYNLQRLSLKRLPERMYG